MQFTWRILMEKNRKGQKELHCICADLENTYSRVLGEELWEFMWNYVGVLQAMNEGSMTSSEVCSKSNGGVSG